MVVLNNDRVLVDLSPITVSSQGSCEKDLFTAAGRLRRDRSHLAGIRDRLLQTTRKTRRRPDHSRRWILSQHVLSLHLPGDARDKRLLDHDHRHSAHYLVRTKLAQRFQHFPRDHAPVDARHRSL